MFGHILHLMPRIRSGYKAALIGVSGFTGRGMIGLYQGKNGTKSLSVVLRGIAGRSAEIHVDGSHAATIAIKNGRAVGRFSSAKGHTLPDFHDGTNIEIRQNGDVVLTGVLSRG